MRRKVLLNASFFTPIWKRSDHHAETIVWQSKRTLGQISRLCTKIPWNTGLWLDNLALSYHSSPLPFFFSSHCTCQNTIVILAAGVVLLWVGLQTVLHWEVQRGRCRENAIHLHRNYHIQVLNTSAIFICHPQGARTFNVKVPLRPWLGQHTRIVPVALCWYVSYTSIVSL